MTNWPVFITAPRAPTKALNRALLLIQDFEYSKYPQDSSWVLLSSMELPSTPPKPTALPISDIRSNDFASLSFADVNTFVRANDGALNDLELSGLLWLIIDQKGLETSTCLVCEQYYDSGEDGGEEGYTDQFRACRMPYEEAWLMTTNLELANMSFEEFVDEDAGQQEDGSWKWSSFAPDTKEFKEKSEAELKRESALKELRDAGHAD
ncbi:hypothetical protein B0H11DRAFT_1955497 [Mycena galericulata]|nr:hypothetical protein B0H11DRAFT_2108123 [Mycena galericulata]KAJ7510620.1 hypothetical protein B0H11DRAFT_1955497 [Mycena galericulata]